MALMYSSPGAGLGVFAACAPNAPHKKIPIGSRVVSARRRTTVLTASFAISRISVSCGERTSTSIATQAEDGGILQVSNPGNGGILPELPEGNLGLGHPAAAQLGLKDDLHSPEPV